ISLHCNLLLNLLDALPISLAKGLLSEKLLDKANDTIQEKGYLDYSYHELEKLLPKLKEKAASFGRTMTSLALQFVLANPVIATRSEEHTSELQSRENLVCR